MTDATQNSPEASPEHLAHPANEGKLRDFLSNYFARIETRNVSKQMTVSQRPLTNQHTIHFLLLLENKLNHGRSK